MPHSALSFISGPLLQWYDANQRSLPWRGEPTPYRVWVSEIMLQQTRVSAALPYFERFVKALPDVHALAEVPDEQLLKLWEGLGYYNRARNLKRAAQVLVEQYGGRLPASPQELEKLPGVGHYTAGAIASIAYGVRAPAVDGNVLRVASRLLNSGQDVSLPAVKKEIEQLVLAAIPADRAGDFNQALMELGALVCLPGGAPRCDGCPLCALCRGFAAGTAAGLPVLPPKKQRRVEEKTVFVIQCGGKIAIHRRPEGGLLPGLWEFPSAEGGLTEELCIKALAEMGVAAEALCPLPAARHVFTHIEWKMTGFLVQAAAQAGEGLVWADEKDFARYALPSAFKPFFAALPWRSGKR